MTIIEIVKNLETTIKNQWRIIEQCVAEFSIVNQQLSKTEQYWEKQKEYTNLNMYGKEDQESFNDK